MSVKKKLLLLMIPVLLIVNGGFIYLYFVYLTPGQATTSPTATQSAHGSDPEPAEPILDDEYYSIHFNYGDAIEVCTLEARSRNSNIIQLSVNELSSRYNPIEKMYLIKLDSHTGTPLLYDEKEHTCHIDPKVQGVAFYQEITRRTAIRPNE